MNEDYPYIKKLGLEVHEKPYPHVRGKDLQKALRKHKITRQFNKLFGVNTVGRLDDGEIAIYLHNIERTLEQVFTGMEPSIYEWD